MYPHVADVLGLASLGLGALLFCRICSTLGLVLWPFKLVAGPLAGVITVAGALAAFAGLRLGTPLACIAGAVGAVLGATYAWRVLRCRGEWSMGWSGHVRIDPEPGAPSVVRLGPRPSGAAAWSRGDVGLLATREAGWQPALQARHEQAATRPARRCAARGRLRWLRDVPFCTPPSAGRPLLCDIWQPPQGVAPSGLAIVYLHSSSWHLADKDVWTRHSFRHLARQGHVVMDVAYRLCPEVDLLGMVGDAERAIVWMKANAERYGADPGRVVAMGASAGGQLALLAAFAPGHPALTPPDLQGADTSVCAAISYYGVVDMRTMYARIAALLPSAKLVRTLAAGPLLGLVEWAGRLVPGRPIAGQAWKLAGINNDGMMASVLGGPPDRVPAMYDVASPIGHAGPQCPPTLLIHGAHDTVVPVSAARALYYGLAAAGVPVAQLILPQTDHIFDLLLPQVSPAAWAAQRCLDRFLARLA
ncbi:MAG TPA: alpha/beta hydrolase [Anaerolineae bacterium]|nr:alpha/beta hydrolase [Anaerolineae bacterium]HPL29687.1 alpha/beta hydrolase [Anaerolineae bacterium]